MRLWEANLRDPFPKEPFQINALAQKKISEWAGIQFESNFFEL